MPVLCRLSWEHAECLLILPGTVSPCCPHFLSPVASCSTYHLHSAEIRGEKNVRNPLNFFLSRFGDSRANLLELSLVNNWYSFRKAGIGRWFCHLFWWASFLILFPFLHILRCWGMETLGSGLTLPYLPRSYLGACLSFSFQMKHGCGKGEFPHCSPVWHKKR